MVGARSLVHMLENKVFTELRNEIYGQRPNLGFALGGSTPIDTDSTIRYGGFTSKNTPLTSPPVVIRWDGQGESLPGKAVFPINSRSQDTLTKLASDCQPVGFESGGEQCLASNVRQMPHTQLSINFEPYSYGIVNAIAQALLPAHNQSLITESDSGVRNHSSEHWGLAADFCWLSVHSAPVVESSLEEPTEKRFLDIEVNEQVDNVIGYLVVCLPTPHKGGGFQLTYKKDSTTLDLGDDIEDTDDYLEDSKIHWAAFRHTCRQEILPVTLGHRVILTYQLIIEEQVGGLLNYYTPTVNAKLFPFWNFIKTLTLQPGFMSQGGFIGFHCQHAYSHVGESTEERMPFALKGVDAMVYAVFQEMGFTIHLQPILDQKFGLCEDEKSNPNLKTIFENPDCQTNWIPMTPEQRQAAIDEHDDDNLRREDDGRGITSTGHYFEEAVYSDNEVIDFVEEGEHMVLRKLWIDYDIFKNVRWINTIDSANPYYFQRALVFGAHVDSHPPIFYYWWTSAAILVEIPQKYDRKVDY